MILRLRSGQILIELTIALAVAMVAILALVQSATKSVSSSTFSKSQTQATQYASEAVEWLRNQKNISWPDFSTRISVPTYCLNTLDWNTPAACTSNMTGLAFKRQLDISGDNLTVKVIWTEKNKDFSAKQVISFSQY
ncbi:MAG: hypothetical protein AAB768_01465 [Patescibacteria group bacterium]